MNLKERLNKVISSKTFNHSVVTFSTTFLNGLLGALFFIILARNLGPENFGLLSVTIATLTLIVDITDFGTNTGVINFVSKNIQKNREKAFRFMKLGLKIKIALSLFVLIIGIMLAPLIAGSIFLKPKLTFPLILAMIGVLGASIFSFVTNSLQAVQKFKSWGFLNIGLNGLRLIVLLLLIYLSFLNINSAIITYISVPFFGFILGIFLLPRRFLYVKNEELVLKDFFGYNKWIAVTILLSAISSRLDTFITTRLLSLKEVGIYSVAGQLTSIVSQLVYAIAIVVAPKLGSFTSNTQAIIYLKKLQLFVFGLSLLGLLGIPIANLLIPVFYGPDFYKSIFPFSVLLIAQLLFLLSVPAHQAIFYYFSNPKIFVIFSFFQFVISAFFIWILTAKFGLAGSAFGVLSGTLFNFLIPSIWVVRRFKK